ncbi:MAG TPA: ATP-binding protein [Cyclobacteriaceae bacterium]|nr:ATP-binding protein [Cyclobacteriaceae bacterium]
MKKLLLILFICLIHLAGLAQTTINKDSLLKLLPAAKEDTAAVWLYINIGNEYELDDPQTAARYYLRAGQLSERLHYKRGRIKFISNYTSILNQRGAFDSSLMLSRQSVQLAREMGDYLILAKTLANAGNVFQYVNEYDSAIYYYETARKYFELVNEKMLVARMYDLLQNTYRELNQNDKALTLSKEAVKILRSSEDSISLGLSIANLGTNYSDVNGDSALRYFNEALIIAQRFRHKQLEMACLMNTGNIYLHRYDPDKMKPFYETALQISRQLDDPESEAIASRGMAHYYLYKHKLDEAKKYITRSLSITDHLDLKYEHAKSLESLSAILFALHDMTGAELALDSAGKIERRITGDEIQKNTMVIAKKFETEKKDNQIKLQQVQLNQKSTLNYFLIAGAMSLLAILLLTYRNYNGRQKLQQAKIDELEAEKQLAATAAVLKGEEQERTRLAKDLHDGLGGMLSGIKYSLNRVKGNIVMTPDNAQAFERSIDMLDSSIMEMRRVAHNMMPEILVKYGLDAALKEFCNEIDRSGVIHVKYQSVGISNAIIEQTTSVTIYRIIQELVNNALKHANAQHVLVQLHQFEQEKLLAVTVEDDGSGFNTDILNQSKGMGWRNIQNRVEFLRGRLDIQASPDKGTSVMIEINM